MCSCSVQKKELMQEGQQCLELVKLPLLVYLLGHTKCEKRDNEMDDDDDHFWNCL